MKAELEGMSGQELKKLLRLAVGSGASGDAYFDDFNRYIDTGPPLFTLTPPALVFGFLWFCYRKIWPPLVPAFIVLIAINILSETSAQLALGLWLLTGSVLGGLFGRRIYFSWILTFVRNAVRRGISGKDLEKLMQREFGTVVGRDGHRPSP